MERNLALGTANRMAVSLALEKLKWLTKAGFLFFFFPQNIVLTSQFEFGGIKAVCNNFLLAWIVASSSRCSCRIVFF